MLLNMASGQSTTISRNTAKKGFGLDQRNIFNASELSPIPQILYDMLHAQIV